MYYRNDPSEYSLELSWCSVVLYIGSNSFRLLWVLGKEGVNWQFLFLPGGCGLFRMLSCC